MASRPKFHEGDTVMICKHLFERAKQGHDIAWGMVRWQGRFSPPKAFTRDDGSSGESHFAVACEPCTSMARVEVDYVEEFYHHGQLHVADFCKGKVKHA